MGTKSVYQGGFLRIYDTALGQEGERLDVLAPVYVYDDFTGVAIDATNDWVSSAVGTSTFARVDLEANGIARITTDAADNADHEVSSPLCLKASKGIGMEVRAAMNDVLGTAMNIGFSDAVSAGANLLAMTYSGTTLTTTAANAAVFFYDPAATTDALRCACVKANVDSAITTGVALVNAVFHTYRVEIDSLGNTNFWYDGNHFATVATAITITTPLCAYIGLINREALVNTMDIDYIRYWSLTR